MIKKLRVTKVNLWLKGLHVDFSLHCRICKIINIMVMTTRYCY